MAQNELIDFLNDETGQWDTTSISKRLETIRLFALERWNPLKPGRKSSEIDKEIRPRMFAEEALESAFGSEETLLSTEEPVK